MQTLTTGHLNLPDVTAVLQQLASLDQLAEGIVRECLVRLETNQPRLNGAVQIFADEAMAAAARPQPGRLSGLPMSVKETFGVAGTAITAGSLRMRPEPVTEDAVIVQRLRAEGAILIARSNVPEFAMTYDTENLRYGRTNNPLNPEYSAGGSSGGEAALVSSGSSLFGVGSDIGGSIRYPAHCCGIVGFKPHSGAIDKTGTWPQLDHFADSMLALGPLTRSVRDARLVYEVIADTPPAPPQAAAGLRLLYPGQFQMTIESAGIQHALQRAQTGLTTAGMIPERLDVPEAGDLYQDFQTLLIDAVEGEILAALTTAEAGEFSLAAEAGRQLLRRPSIHKYVFNFLTAARLVRPNEKRVTKAVTRVKLMRQKYHELLGSDGVWLLPTCGALAMKHGKASAAILRPGVPEIFTPTTIVNVLNLSAISAPAWLDIDRRTGLVPGIMLACAPGAEGALLDAAAALEKIIS